MEEIIQEETTAKQGEYGADSIRVLEGLEAAEDAKTGAPADRASRGGAPNPS